MSLSRLPSVLNMRGVSVKSIRNIMRGEFISATLCLEHEKSVCEVYKKYYERWVYLGYPLSWTWEECLWSLQEILWEVSLSRLPSVLNMRGVSVKSIRNMRGEFISATLCLNMRGVSVKSIRNIMRGEFISATLCLEHERSVCEVYKKYYERWVYLGYPLSWTWEECLWSL